MTTRTFALAALAALSFAAQVTSAQTKKLQGKKIAARWKLEP